MNANNSSITVNTADMSPAAAEQFVQLFQVLGDKANMIYQPEVQKRIMDYLASEVVEDFIFQWDTSSELNSNASLPEFPVAGMPSVLRDMVEGVAEALQVSADLAAVIALAVLSAALVGRVKVDVGGTWEETLTIYALGLAESGNRKSATMNRLTAPLFEVQAKLRKALDDERKKLVVKKSVAEARMKSAQRKVNKDADMGSLTELEEATEEFDAIEVPDLPTLIVNDATPEAMALALGGNGERLGCFDAEGGGLTTMAGARYGNGNSSNIDLLLKGHVGDPVSQKRVGRPDIVLASPVLSIGILSQPQTLRELVAVPGSAGRGLVDRFLIAAPPDRLGRRNLTPRPLSQATREAYTAMLASYAMTLWAAEERYTLRVSGDAWNVLKQFEEQCEAKLAPGGELRAMGGFGSKLVGSAVRLAGLHHLAKYGVQAAFHHEIGVDSMQWGVTAAEWSLEHYRYAVAMAGEIAEISDAEKVLNWLRSRTNRTETITQRDVQKAMHFDKAERAEQALELLAEHNWVRPAKDRRTGGRPSKRWEVHPSLVGAGMDAA